MSLSLSTLSPFCVGVIAQACELDTSLTPLSSIFIALTVLISALVYLRLRGVYDQLERRYLIAALCVLVFQIFTAPLWTNHHLGFFGYLYLDVSWIFTLAITTVLMIALTVARRISAALPELVQVATATLISSTILFVLELLCVWAGIRSYTPLIAPHIEQSLLLGVPVMIYVIILAFCTVVYCFYHFWEYVLDGRPILPFRHQHLLPKLLIAIAVIAATEMIVDPVITSHYPAWTNYYHDVSFIQTGIWIIIIYLADVLVEHIIPTAITEARFVAVVAVASIIATAYEAYAYTHGIRSYSPAVAADFSGLTVPLFQVPLEAVAYVPIYLGVVYSAIRYLQIVTTPHAPLFKHSLTKTPPVPKQNP